MDYKIKITAENQEAIKEIANRKGMNENNCPFHNNYTYHIKNGKFQELSIAVDENFDSLTFEQFKAMFDKKETQKIIHYIYAVDDIEVWNWFCKNFDSEEDKNDIRNFRKDFKYYGCFEFGRTPKFIFDNIKDKEEQLNAKLVKLTLKEFKEKYMKNETQETDLEKWLRETKAKNLSLEELREEINSTPTREIYEALEGEFSADKGRILFNQWNEPKPEWQPKRGDRVLVWDNCEKDAVERIFLTEIKGTLYPIITVYLGQETNFSENKTFQTGVFKHMKPLPIAPTEPEKTFKDKVIELVEKRIELCKELIEENKSQNKFIAAQMWKNCDNEAREILTQIKKLN